MKCIVCKKPGKLEIQDISKPELPKGTAIIKIKRIGICGTDIRAYKGTQPFFSYPRVLGHELPEEIVEIEKDTPYFRVGDPVTFIPYYSCGECIAYRRGKPNCCVNIRGVGVHIDGGMVEYLSVPVHALIHGKGLGYEELALVEPLAIRAHAVRLAAVSAVIGASCSTFNNNQGVEFTEKVSADWENQTVFEINRELPRVWFVPFSSEKEARESDPLNSPLILLLNGPWKFHLSKNPGERPYYFYMDDFDTRDWD